jgi:formamidopyrimidine-DNA glycosylase
MPEVIEVREYTDFCNKYIKNKELLNIKILNGRYKKHGPFNGFKQLLKTLPLKIVKIENKGKFMYIQLNKEDPIYIGITLGLTGGWFFNPKGLKEKYIHGLNRSRYIDSDIEKYQISALKHLNVEFVFDHGSLYFYDQLSFGTISIFDNTELLEKKLKIIGLDIMDVNTSFDMFQNALLHKTNLNKEIGNALMNQKYISGIGNYLRADALWLSKINPFIKVKSLSNNDLKKIYHNVRLLIWGQYNKKAGIKYGIIKKSDKLPIDYNRNFFVYQQDTDIYGKQVFKEKLYEGSQIRYIFYTKIGNLFGLL